MPSGEDDPRRRRVPSAYGTALVVLVSLQAFAAFLDANASQTSRPWRVVLYAVATTVVFVGALVLAVRWSRGDRDRMAVAVAGVAASFLNFSVLFDADPADDRKLAAVLLVWLLLTAIAARLLYLVGGNDNVRFALLIFVGMTLLLPTVSYASYQASDHALEPVADPGPLPIPDARPNVYWLMLDQYARPDVLERVMGFDDEPFVRELEGRGFQVSSTSRTSYPRTHLSLASTLEMDYVVEPGQEIGDDFERFAPVVLGNNATVARFRALGYQIVYGEAGGIEWSGCRADLVDVCLPIVRPSPATGELEQTLLDRTPLGVFALPVPHGNPLSFADGLVDPELGVRAPFFAFQHVLSPHYPYRYRDDCSARDRPLDARRTTPAERVQHYRTQIRCLNGLVTEALDRIIERDPSAVVIVQSDHGSDLTVTRDLHPDDWTPPQVTERYGVFNAMRLPAGCDADIEGQPLVNTFAIVFGCVEGTDPELRDYRGFTMPIDDVTDVTELTEGRFEEETGPEG
ncbi:MAG: hypothetical protein ABL966_05430 [Acidimicrobiales bacterium]